MHTEACAPASMHARTRATRALATHSTPLDASRTPLDAVLYYVNVCLYACSTLALRKLVRSIPYGYGRPPAFRFGRKLQMEIARKRRDGGTATSHAAAAPPPHREQPQNVAGTGGGVYQRKAPTASTEPAGATTTSRPSNGTQATSGWSRETLTVIGIGFVMVVLLVGAVLTPGDDIGRGSNRARSRGR